MNDKIIGIIGGMGPEATISFYERIIRNTKINKEQDHFHVIIDSNAKIPDRTESILHNSDAPLKYLIQSADNLKKLNAYVAGIGCITAHYFLDELRKSTDLTIISAIDAVNDKLSTLGIKKIGILATTGTIQTGLFNELDYQIIYPDDTIQENVMDSIYGTKGVKHVGRNEYNYNMLIDAGKHLVKKGADVIILGCTEIPIVLNEDNTPFTIIDPLDELAIKLIKEASN